MFHAQSALDEARVRHPNGFNFTPQPPELVVGTQLPQYRRREPAKVEKKREEWFPGPKFCTDVSLYSLTAEVPMTQSAINSANDKLSSFYALSEPLSSYHHPAPDKILNYQPALAEIRRVIYVRPDVYAAFATFDEEEFKKLWRDFFKALKVKGPTDYSKFKAPWYDERTEFVSGREILKTYATGENDMLHIHQIRTKKGREKANCFLSHWLLREPNNRELLHRMMKEKGHDLPMEEVIDLPFPTSLDMQGLTKESFRTILPCYYPAHALLDAYLGCIRHDDAIILGTEFTHHLNAQAPQVLGRLCTKWYDNLINAKVIVAPLFDSLTKHWALAIVRPNSSEIEIVDCRLDRRTFIAIFPDLLHWASTIPLYLGTQWNSSHRIRERDDATYNVKSGLDTPFIMLYHAYTITTFDESLLKEQVDVKVIRDTVRRSVEVMQPHPFAPNTASLSVQDGGTAHPEALPLMQVLSTPAPQSEAPRTTLQNPRDPRVRRVPRGGSAGGLLNAANNDDGPSSVAEKTAAAKSNCSSEQQPGSGGGGVGAANGGAQGDVLQALEGQASGGVHGGESSSGGNDTNKKSDGDDSNEQSESKTTKAASNENTAKTIDKKRKEIAVDPRAALIASARSKRRATPNGNGASMATAQQTVKEANPAWARGINPGAFYSAATKEKEVDSNGAGGQDSALTGGTGGAQNESQTAVAATTATHSTSKHNRSAPWLSSPLSDREEPTAETTEKVKNAAMAVTTATENESAASAVTTGTADAGEALAVTTATAKESAASLVAATTVTPSTASAVRTAKAKANAASAVTARNAAKAKANKSGVAVTTIKKATRSAAGTKADANPRRSARRRAPTGDSSAKRKTRSG